MPDASFLFFLANIASSCYLCTCSPIYITYQMKLSEIKFPSSIFITGIGTDVGKSFATGWLAREMNAAGVNCITQKMIQTGNSGKSEDIDRHRKIMGTGYFKADTDGTTAPVIFSYPASPHLAAEIDGKNIDLDKISCATKKLEQEFGHVLIEGAGGLMVPICGEFLTADYIVREKLPVAVTVTGQLGSINHALLTFNALKTYGIELFAVIYNPFFDKDHTICSDTRKYLRDWLSSHFPDAYWWEMPTIE